MSMEASCVLKRRVFINKGALAMKLKFLTLVVMATVAGATVNVSMAQNKEMKQMALSGFSDVTPTYTSKKLSAFGMTCSALADSLNAASFAYVPSGAGVLELKDGTGKFIIGPVYKVGKLHSVAIISMAGRSDEPLPVVTSPVASGKEKISIGGCVFLAAKSASKR